MNRALISASAVAGMLVPGFSSASLEPTFAAPSSSPIPRAWPRPVAAAPHYCLAGHPCPGTSAAICFTADMRALTKASKPCPEKLTVRFAEAPQLERR